MLNGLLEQLYARRRFGMRPGLELTEALMARLGNPEQSLAAVHVAGTNGKGSVTVFIAAMLQAAGFQVGRYTSPHLLHVNERVAINGQPIANDLLAASLAEVMRAADELERDGAGQATFFEIATAAAWVAFRQRNIRLAVIETGLGGRLDATNVLRPLLSVITSIGLEHRQYLGDTIEQIAGEKAGIIKPGRPVVIGAMPEAAAAVMRSVAHQAGAPLVDASHAVNVTVAGCTLAGLTVRLSSGDRDLGKVKLGLGGAFQAGNAATALAAIDALSAAAALEIPDDACRNGLAAAVWPGRFQLVRECPAVLVDGAHNPEAAAGLREAVRRCRFKGPIAILAGLCDDKDAAGFFRALAPMARIAWAVPVPSSRSLTPELCAAQMQAAGLSATAATLDAALEAGQAWAAAEGGLLVVCGSLFLAGEVVRRFGAMPWPPPDRPPEANESLRTGA